MAEIRPRANVGARPVRVMLVDDEPAARAIVAAHLLGHGFDVRAFGDAASGIQALREERPDALLIDRRLRLEGGGQALAEFQKVAPRIPIVVLTGHSRGDDRAAGGRSNGFVFVEKPCEPGALREALLSAVAQHAAPEAGPVPRHRRAFVAWLWGRVGYRPGVLLAGACVLAAFLLAPAPPGLVATLSSPRQAEAAADPIASYPDYGKMGVGESIAQARSGANASGAGTGAAGELAEAVWSAKAMLGVLLLAGLYWATRALPVSVTGMVVGLLMYACGVFPADRVAAAFVPDPVVMLAAGLVVAGAAASTGLYRRIGAALLALSRTPLLFAFVGLPFVAGVSSMLPGWAVLAFAIPGFAALVSTAEAADAEPGQRRAVAGAVLASCFAANIGAAGSPLGSGRNAVLLATLGDWRQPLLFGSWLRLAAVPVAISALVVGAYWLLAFGLAHGPPMPVQHRQHRPWSRGEKLTVAVVVGMLALWLLQAIWPPLRVWALAGPALLGVVVLVLARVVDASALSRVPWATVVSFAGVCAVAKGLGSTGAATWLGNALGGRVSAGGGGAMALMATTLVAGALLATLFGEVASVAIAGPLAVASASAIGLSPATAAIAAALAVSLANSAAMASSANAVAATLAKDPRTGVPIVGSRHFLVHGAAVTAVSIAALLGWAWWTVRGGG